MSVIEFKDYVDSAPYKEMYITMARAVRDAIELNNKADRILIEAMQTCEEMYISAGEENDKGTQ